MKISESSLELQASSLRATRLEVKESLSVWGGQGAAVERGGLAHPIPHNSQCMTCSHFLDPSDEAGDSRKALP